MKIADKRISGVHITLLAVVNNLSSFVHKNYIFMVVDNFGIFLPQLVLFFVGLIGVLVFGRKMISFEDKDISVWHVSSKVLMPDGLFDTKKNK